MNASACMSHLRTASSFTRNRRDLETQLAFSPSTRISRKCAPQTRHVLQQVKCKANSLDRSISSSLVPRSFAAARDADCRAKNIGQAWRCHRADKDSKISSSTMASATSWASEFDLAPGETNSCQNCWLFATSGYPGRRTDAAKDRCKPHGSPGTDCHSTLAPDTASSTHVAQRRMKSRCGIADGHRISQPTPLRQPCEFRTVEAFGSPSASPGRLMRVLRQSDTPMRASASRRLCAWLI